MKNTLGISKPIKDKQGVLWFDAESIARSLGYKTVQEALEECDVRNTSYSVKFIIRWTRGKKARLVMNANAARRIAVESFLHWNAENVHRIINHFDTSAPKLA